MKQIQGYLARIPDNVVVAIAMAVVVIALWLPVGFRTTATYEEWYARAYNEQSEQEYLRPVAELVARPTSIWPFWLAYVLTPDSFVSNNLMTIFLLWGKGFMLYLILRRLIPKHVLPAFFVGVIFAIYPADTGVVSLRISHIHTNILFFLIAVYCLLVYWDRPRWPFMVAIWVLLGSAMLMYETTYLLIFLTPVLLLLKERRVTRRLLLVLCLWYFVPLLTFMYSYYTIFILDFRVPGSSHLQIHTLNYYWDKLGQVYWDNLLGGWKYAQALLRLHAGPKEIAITCLAVIAMLGGGSWLLRHEKNRGQLSPMRFLGIAIISLVMIGAAFAIYLPTNRADSDETFRLYLLTSLGAAIFWGYSLYYFTHLLFPKYRRHLYILGMSFLVALAVVRGIYAHYDFAEISKQQGRFLQQVTRQVPQLDEPATFLLIQTRGNPEYNAGPLLVRSILSSALQYIYQDYALLRGAHFCPYQPVGNETVCVLNDNGVAMTHFGWDGTVANTEIPYEQLLLLEVASDGTIQLLASIPQSNRYQPDKLIDELAAPPYRISTIFGLPSLR